MKITYTVYLKNSTVITEVFEPKPTITYTELEEVINEFIETIDNACLHTDIVQGALRFGNLIVPFSEFAAMSYKIEK